MKVIFDFDDVIFNSKQFKKNMFQILSKEGYTNAEDVYAAFRKTEVPFSLTSFLSDNIGIDSQDVRHRVYEEIMFSCSTCLHQDVVVIMNELTPAHYIIITHGEESFQKEKIARSLGNTLTSHVVVVPKSKAEAIEKFCKKYPDEQIIFVDDRLDFINGLHFNECPNLKTVLFNENGLENLKAEMLDSRQDELKRGVPSETLSLPNEVPSEPTKEMHIPVSAHSDGGMTAFH